MARNPVAFIVSIEPRGTKTWQLERNFTSYVDARAEAEAQFRTGDVVTVAVMQHGKICDVFDGRWSSEYVWEDEHA